MTIHTTLYPNVTVPFGAPPSAVVTDYTITSTAPVFTQAGLTTPTAKPTSTLVPFTGGSSSMALEWWLTVGPIAAAMFWTFA